MHIFHSFILLTALITEQDFITEQKKFARVKEAFETKEELITENLEASGLSVNNINIVIVAYKEDAALEIFAKKKEESTYRLISTYDVCARSGIPGPKRRSGDGQVPEGFYYISRFNPASNFHLSLGINYPNQSDRLKSKAADPGGDIFIHGNCVTIGCLPMTDDRIKEIYLYAVHARNDGQEKIPVYIFPFRMSDVNMKKYESDYAESTALLSFWKNIKTGYDKFEKEAKELKYSFAKNGDYLFK
jgi:murein L,D-transpeptidase YafK